MTPSTATRRARLRDFLTRTICAAGLVARDDRIPRPLRALTAVALLPIPGPFDEAVLLVLAPLLYALYRKPMRDAWRRAGAVRDETRA